jgi:hypothetical protein
MFSFLLFFSFSFLSFYPLRAQESEGSHSIKKQQRQQKRKKKEPRSRAASRLHICVYTTYLLGHLLDVDAASGPAVEVGAHEGVDLGEERGADHVWPREREHGAPHGAVERAVHGGDVVGPQDVEHGLRVARDEAGALAGQRPPVQLRLHAHHRGAAQDVRPEQTPVPAMPTTRFLLQSSYVLALLLLLLCFFLLLPCLASLFCCYYYYYAFYYSAIESRCCFPSTSLSLLSASSGIMIRWWCFWFRMLMMARYYDNQPAEGWNRNSAGLRAFGEHDTDAPPLPLLLLRIATFLSFFLSLWYYYTSFLTND